MPHRLELAEGTPEGSVRLRLERPFTPLLEEPRRQAAQLSELVHGQAFEVHTRAGGFAYGRALSPLPGSSRTDYVGWVRADGLEPPEDPLTHRIATPDAPVFSRADFKSFVSKSLPRGSAVAVMATKGGYCHIGARGWMHAAHLRPLTEPETDPVAVARRYLSQPYVWGGNGARGVDCSGLVQMALVACGMDAPRDADQQEKALGVAVDADAVAAGEGKRGDLLFWPGHVGMLSAPETLLHANAHHMCVVEEPLGPALERMAGAGVVLRSVKRLG